MSDESERKTRTNRVDPELRWAGWKVVLFDPKKPLAAYGALSKLADSIEKREVKATERVERLIQAILAKAFRGELVPTEAELARRESRSYEPASALLARRKDERSSTQMRTSKLLVLE